jgi:tRNA (adenine57-N1/adenine58-N1)-methyltransferase
LFICIGHLGSGSLSVSISRAVAPLGHLHTFDFHAERAQKARDDFALLQLESFITVHHRDVVARGFPRVEGDADAVFLDLPTPWTVVPMAKNVLKDGGRICCFSPCIEQVQRNCESLAAHGFEEIKTVEFVLRDWDIGTTHFSLPPYHILDTLLDNNKITSESKHKNKKRKLNEDSEVEEKNQPTVSYTGQAYSALRPFPNYRAHTGYLTFATCWHFSDDEVVSVSPSP